MNASLAAAGPSRRTLTRVLPRLLALAAFAQVPMATCLGATRAVVVWPDGSVVTEPAEAQENHPAVFRFGLPQCRPGSRDDNSGVLRTVWTTNGIRYTQTVLLDDLNPTGTGGIGAVLLVNIRGENTNAEYAEARAAFELESLGKWLPLELKEGLVWAQTKSGRSLIAALEIPASGIKRTNGPSLLFAGGMPPSEKGSMTWKIPLEKLHSQTQFEALQDIDFEAALRRRAHTLKAPGLPRIRFQND